MPPYHVLTIDGGGIRGLLTTILLERLEVAVPGFLSKIDLFAGTSTGARSDQPSGRQHMSSRGLETHPRRNREPLRARNHNGSVGRARAAQMCWAIVACKRGDSERAMMRGETPRRARSPSQPSSSRRSTGLLFAPLGLRY